MTTQATKLFEFDEDTAVEPIGEGRFIGRITDRWSHILGPDGGYVLAIATAAMARHLPHPHPFTVTGHFLRRAVAGPAEISVSTVRVGRRHSTAEARLMQEGKEIVRALGTFGDLNAGTGITGETESPPTLPPPEDCVDPWEIVAEDFRTSLADRVDVRLAEAPPWMTGHPSGIPRFDYYQRFKDRRSADPISMLFFADAAPPGVVELGHLPTATLELTVHIRDLAAAGWLTLRKDGRHIKGGYFTEDVNIWDSEGRVVAACRQLGIML